MSEKKEVQPQEKMFKVYDEKDRMIGHISAVGEAEALDKAKKRNPGAVKVGPHGGGTPQPAPAKDPAVVVGDDAAKAKADAEAKAAKEKEEADAKAKADAGKKK